MRFIPTRLPGAVIIEPEIVEDSRGGFARVFSRTELAEQGLDPHVEQCSISLNTNAFTLRGMHYQVGAAAEIKYVRCTSGRIFDVAVDMRPESPAYLSWAGVELSATNRRTLYVPAGFAHGFLTLVRDTEVFYQISTAHRPEAARGARWDDPAIGIDWPAIPTTMSERDASYPLLPPLKA